MSVVEVGQYFVTRNASEFLLRSVVCREYTLPRDDPDSKAKGWIKESRRNSSGIFSQGSLRCSSLSKS